MAAPRSSAAPGWLWSRCAAQLACVLSNAPALTSPPARATESASEGPRLARTTRHSHASSALCAGAGLTPAIPQSLLFPPLLLTDLFPLHMLS
eukprot:scaffold207_cov409-Prasinococcus_capsulatus_cf.AAC.97